MNITPTNISAIRSALSLGVPGMISPLSDGRHDSIENFVRDMVVPNTFAEKLQASAPVQRFVGLRPHQITADSAPSQDWARRHKRSRQSAPSNTRSNAECAALAPVM